MKQNMSKKLKFKKFQQKKRQLASKTVSIIKQYSTQEWLETIRKLNINHNKFNDINDQIKSKPEFLVVATDMTLRISKNITTGNIPSIMQVFNLLNREIELTDGPKNIIKLFGIGGVSLLATWQNRFHYTPTNMLGRMQRLYKHYDSYLLKNINLSIQDMYIILLAILEAYNHKEKIYFKKEDITSKQIPNLYFDKIDNFLSYFSINQDNYIQIAKANGIYEKSFGKFKYLIRYPIIQIESNFYIIPVFEQLIDTISNNLYFLLLESFAIKDRNSSKKFLDEFGLILEEYVLDLARNPFGVKKVVDANRIVKNKYEFRCEAVVIHKKKALAIEVKKMYFKRDAIELMDKKHIDDLLKDHIVKAYQQIESTLKYICYEKYFGLIVIPDIMLGLSSIKSYIINKFTGMAKFDEHIFICTLSSYEALMANTDDDVFLILEHVKKRNFNEGDDINMVMIEMIKNGMDIKMTNDFLQN